MADRGPWYTITDLRPTRKGINVHRHDGVLVAYSCISNAAEHWAVYERATDGAVWSFTIFRETAKMEQYLNDPKKFPQKAS